MPHLIHRPGGRSLLRSRAAGLLTATGLVLFVGCGGTARTGTAPSGAPTASVSDSGGATPTAASPAKYTFTAKFALGWTYAGSFSMPTEQLQFAKDVTSSAPGTAAIAETSTGLSPELGAPLHDTNPGRPGGPPAYLRLYWRYAEVDNTTASIGNFGNCAPTDNNLYLDCLIAAQDDGYTEAAGPSLAADEGIVDKFVKFLNPQKPSLVVEVRGEGECRTILVDPGSGSSLNEGSDCTEITVSEPTR